MSCGEMTDASPRRVSNFGASNGFNKGPSITLHGKPGSVKKLVVKNQKGVLRISLCNHVITNITL